MSTRRWLQAGAFMGALLLTTSVFARVIQIGIDPPFPVEGQQVTVHVMGTLPGANWDPAVAHSSVSGSQGGLLMAVIAKEVGPNPNPVDSIFYVFSQVLPSLEVGRYNLGVVEYHNSFNYPDPELGFTTFTVYPDMSGTQQLVRVPADVATLQAALDLVISGGTVLVAPGTYAGPGNVDLVLHGKQVTLASETGAANTIMSGANDQNAANRWLSIESWDQDGTVIRGFTFRNFTASGTLGWGDSPGGGVIRSRTKSFTVQECTFLENKSTALGGAIYFDSCAATIQNCTFEDNISDWAGGAICSYNGGILTVEDCAFRNDSSWGYGGAISLARTAGPSTITDCYFDHNRSTHGGAMLFYNAAAVVSECSFSNNVASQQGGVCFMQDNASPSFTNCTIVNNTGTIGGVFHIDERGIAGGMSAPAFNNCIIAFNKGDKPFVVQAAHPTFSCTDIYGNEEGDWIEELEPFAAMNNNLSADPQFCDLTNNVLGLSAGSPCAAANNACNALIGAFDVECGGVGGNGTEKGQSTGLAQNFPNPFNPTTEIAYTLATPTNVRLVVYNLLGQEVVTLADGMQSAGEHHITWSGQDDRGHDVASGVYFYRLEAGTYTAARKMSLVK